MEIAQTRAVLQEATEMVSMLERDRHRLEREHEQIRRRIVQIRSMLRPVRAAAAAVLPPEIGLLDMNVGQRQEQIAQIDRVARSLALPGYAERARSIRSSRRQRRWSKRLPPEQCAGFREGERPLEGRNGYVSERH